MNAYMKIKLIALFILVLSATEKSFAQQPLTLDQAIQTALKNNLSLRVAEFDVQSQRSLKGTAFDLPKTSVTMMKGQYNSNEKADNNLSVTQTIPFTALGSQGRYNRSLLASSEFQLSVTRNELIYQIRQVYLELTYAKARQKLLLRQDSIYQGFLKAAAARYKTGETKMLEQATAETQANEVKNQLRQNAAKVSSLQSELRVLINTDVMPDAADELRAFHSGTADSLLLNNNPSLQYMNQQIEVATSQKKLEAARFAPDIVVGAFSQTLIGTANTETGVIATNNDRFTGFQVGLAIPLWFGPHLSRVRAAQFNKQAAESNYAYFRQTLESQQQQAINQHEAARNSLAYYESSALVNAELILTQSQVAFRGGEITYTEYLMALRNAVSVNENYLATLWDYNKSIIYIEYLSGNQ